jgi:hypothetical protein
MSIIKRLSGLSQIYSNDIIATGNIDSTQDISGYTIVGNPSSYFLSISSNIQTQINSLQNAISGINLTISGDTISGVVLLSYLETYYYTIQEIKDINTNAYIAMIDTFDNYYSKSSINSLSKSLSDNILSISDSLVITNNNVTFYKNGTSQGVISYTFDSAYDYFIRVGNGSGTADSFKVNFGNPAYSANSYTDANGFGNFSYAVPSGYYALCTKNLYQYGF